MNVERPVLRYHGGKFRMAQWLISLFPAHTCYVEPFGGGAGVLLQKPRCYSEVYNDLDRDVANFFMVLRDERHRKLLLEQLVMTPYAREEFLEAWKPALDPIERARRLAIRAQMGFGSAGATKGATGFRIDSKREYGTAQQLWALYPSAVAAAGQRLSGVLIENQPAIDCMAAHDAVDTLHYVDPPYLHSTRVRIKRPGHIKYYKHEMSDEEHQALIAFVRTLQGYVIISGYQNDMYDAALHDWAKRKKFSRASAGRGGAVRTEVVWMNPRAAAAQTQVSVFHD